MKKEQLNEYLNDIKREYIQLEQKDKANEVICEETEKSLKSYVTLSGITKCFVPFDILNASVGIGFIAAGETALGAILTSLGAIGFIGKLLNLKYQKKQIKEAKESIAIGKFAQAVNKISKEEMKKEIDRVTEIIYVDDEPEL